MSNPAIALHASAEEFKVDSYDDCAATVFWEISPPVLLVLLLGETKLLDGPGLAFLNVFQHIMLPSGLKNITQQGWCGRLVFQLVETCPKIPFIDQIAPHTQRKSVELSVRARLDEKPGEIYLNQFKR